MLTTKKKILIPGIAGLLIAAVLSWTFWPVGQPVNEPVFGTGTTAKILVVASGGAGGGGDSGFHGGGGSAGQVTYAAAQAITVGLAYTVTVGTGGTPGTNTYDPGNDGAVSSFGALISAAKGEGGAGYDVVGQNGYNGSGGGEGSGTTRAGGTGTSGRNGGTSSNGGASGGGAGDSVAGGNASSGTGGSGGNGTAYDITGASVTYGGGGGGAGDSAQGSGGTGGGGNGVNGVGQDGTDGLGGGGGGGGNGARGGNGGDGRVIVSWVTADFGANVCTGTSSTDGANSVCTFNAADSGETFTFLEAVAPASEPKGKNEIMLMSYYFKVENLVTVS